MENQDYLIELLNKTIKNCKPIKIEEFNRTLEAIHKYKMVQLEIDNPKLGITCESNITTISLIATITDILCDKRLSFMIDEDSYIVGVMWFTGETN